MKSRPPKPNLDADPIYESLVRSKRIAVVGPALTTVGTGQGRQIDACDLVVRFNDAIDHMPFDAARAADIGTRADIVYANPVVLREQIADRQGTPTERPARRYEELGVKYLVCTNNALSYAATGQPDARCGGGDAETIADVERFFRRHGLPSRIRVVHAASRMLNRWLHGHFGRTGFVALADLLTFDVSHLYITGMTFYHGGGHLFPQSAEDLHPLKNRDGTWARDRSGLGHDSFLELQAMRVLARCFRHRLTLDEPLQRLLDQGP